MVLTEIFHVLIALTSIIYVTLSVWTGFITNIPDLLYNYYKLWQITSLLPFLLWLCNKMSQIIEICQSVYFDRSKIDINLWNLSNLTECQYWHDRSAISLFWQIKNWYISEICQTWQKVQMTWALALIICQSWHLSTFFGQSAHGHSVWQCVTKSVTTL